MNIEKGIYETTEYLELFLKNLILKENNKLKNRYLHINLHKKVDIENEKVDIDSLKLTNKLRKNILSLY